VDALGPLLLLGFVLFAATALLALRRRALRRPLTISADAEAPLAPGELTRLRRWHRRVRRALGLVAVAYIGLVAATLVDGEPPAWRAATALALLGAACLLATAIQFSERCPRCGYNLGFQSRLALPAACERCGGALS
jgi:peptidoglycan/LPS O-acetylase OafA/YrhL